MCWLIVPLALAAIIFPLSFFGPKSAADPSPLPLSPTPGEREEKAVGIDKRVPWTTFARQGFAGAAAAVPQ